MGRKVNVTLYYELFLNDEDEAAYKAIDKDCDPDLILFWSKLCRKHGVIVGCNDVQLPPMTNADKIRSMTDEKLAESLGILTDCTQCMCKNTDDSCNIVDGTCQKQWLDWLKEEAKGEADED